MGDWGYFELITFYYRSFLNTLEQNRSIEDSIKTTFDDYFFEPKEKYETLHLIISIQTLDLQLAMMKKVSRWSVNFYNNQLKSASKELMFSQLSKSELEHLEESILELNIKLKKLDLFKLE
ncbi:hypothetical protein [Dysgonomonas sp. 520]|uniref:hypothetical protein n=1 Tax=Dysgonomonas sp. 520 TaxID=2302931 RepID=UPI0013D5333C|nr:hypothetical protein [Dysgonomonas sp. 520]NDW11223.1 hypothetical protein [Dysgonomonas sp. 520]